MPYYIELIDYQGSMPNVCKQQVASFKFTCGIYSPPTIIATLTESPNLNMFNVFDSNDQLSRKYRFVKSANDEETGKDIFSVKFSFLYMVQHSNTVVFTESEAYKLDLEYKLVVYNPENGQPCITLDKIINKMSGGVVIIPDDNGTEIHPFEPPAFSRYIQQTSLSTWKTIIGLLSKYGYGLCYSDGKYMVVDTVLLDYVKNFSHFITHDMLPNASYLGKHVVNQSLDINTAVAFSRLRPKVFNTLASGGAPKKSYNEKLTNKDYGHIVCRYAGIKNVTSLDSSVQDSELAQGNTINPLGKQMVGMPGTVYSYFEDSYSDDNYTRPYARVNYKMTAAERGLKAKLNSINMRRNYMTLSFQFDPQHINQGFQLIPSTITYMTNRADFTGNYMPRQKFVGGDASLRKVRNNLMKAPKELLMKFVFGNGTQQQSLSNTTFRQMVEDRVSIYADGPEANNKNHVKLGDQELTLSSNQGDYGDTMLVNDGGPANAFSPDVIEPSTFKGKKASSNSGGIPGPRAAILASWGIGISNPADLARYCHLLVNGYFFVPQMTSRVDTNKKWIITRAKKNQGILGIKDEIIRSADIGAFEYWKDFFYFTSIYTEQGELLWSRIPGFDHEKYVAERKEASKNGGSYSFLRTLTEENQKVYGLIGDRNKSYNANSMPIFGKFIVLGYGLNAENSESIKYDLTFYTNLSAFEEHDIN